MDCKYKKVAVIMGGNSSEREISLLSGIPVLEALRRVGVNAFKFDPSEQSILNLVKDEFDAAVIMLHGVGGEDGTIQGALEYLKIPYTGSNVLGSSIAIDKLKTKIIWEHYNIPMPKWQSVLKRDYNSEDFNLEIDFPLIVKPLCEGSTVGITKVYRRDELSKAIDFGFKYDDTILIEELIIGGEYTASVFNRQVYPLIKIEALNENYDYNSKYFSDDTKYICPAVLPDSLVKTINQYVVVAYDAVGASGIARVDFMINQNNQVFFLEINTIPGMTAHSLVPMSFKAVGKSFEELCLEMLNDAKLYAHNKSFYEAKMVNVNQHTPTENKVHFG